jgi:DNA-binding TFAR19-related protein (PDSD5 family)
MSIDLDSLKAELGMQSGGSEQRKQQEQQKAMQEERKNTILHTLLTPEALERCSPLYFLLIPFLSRLIVRLLSCPLVNRIGIVKPEQKALVENMLFQLAPSLSEKVNEDALVKLIERVSSSAPEVKVTIKRRGGTWDDDDVV